MMIFKNRQAAGSLLAKRLNKFKEKPDTLVLGIPRGGVVVASEVAKKLNLPLDVVVTRKIGAPFQKELALGAVDADGEVVWERELLEDLGIKIYDLKEEVQTQKEEIKRREEVYRQGKKPPDIDGKTVILVDDGIATGATTLSAVRYLKKQQVKKVILAVTVASQESMKRLEKEGIEFEVLYIPEFLGAVGEAYQDFGQVSDEEVIQLLNHG